MLCLRHESIGHLLPLHMKASEAESKMTEAVLYSDYRRSIGAYKAAHTKASNRLHDEIDKHLASIGEVDNSLHEKAIAISTRLYLLESIILGGMIEEAA